MIEVNNIYNEDCLIGMDKIPENSVDLIISDLPYGTTQNSWDRILDFKILWEQYNRISKEDAPIILFGSQPFTTLMIGSNISNFREELIWLKNKAGSGLRAKNRHLKTHENIILFCQSGKYTYNPEKWNIKDKKFLTQRKTLSIYGESNNNYGNIKSVRKKDDGTRFPISILSYKVPFTGSKNKKYSDNIDLNLHPTQKPLDLIRYLIRTYSNKDAVVLDNCIGSGTTAVASILENRKYVGFEIDEKYYNIAKERIANIRRN